MFLLKTFVSRNAPFCGVRMYNSKQLNEGRKRRTLTHDYGEGTHRSRDGGAEEWRLPYVKQALRLWKLGYPQGVSLPRLGQTVRNAKMDMLRFG